MPIDFISIHSLRMEGDIYLVENHKFRIISIHSLRMEGDDRIEIFRAMDTYFNPLPPYGGRRRCKIDCESWKSNFNPLPPYGGRRTPGRSGYFRRLHFNPLPPYGGRLPHMVGRSESGYFNPLPPYGGRRYSDFKNFANLSFQSTPSVWRETCRFFICRNI